MTESGMPPPDGGPSSFGAEPIKPDRAGSDRAGPAERLLVIGGKILAALTGGVQTRVELLAAEMAAEWSRLGRLLLSALALAVSALLGLAFLSFWIIAYFWDTHRLTAIAVVTIFYWAVALFLGVSIWRWFGRRNMPFAATADTLRRDYQAILRSIGITPNEPVLPEDEAAEDR